MNDLLKWIFIFGALIIFAIYGLSKLEDSQAQRLYAQSHVIAAKSDARLDFMGAAMPYVVMILGVVGIGAAVAICLAIIVGGAVGVLAIMRHYDAIKSQGPPVMILQIQGGSPRDVYKMLEATSARVIDVQHK